MAARNVTGPRSNSRRPTLKDVALAASVDPSLVSKLINNHPQLSISDATRARVLDAIERLGYQPSAAARGFRLHRTFMLGFLLPDLTNPVYAPIVRGANRRAADLGYAIVLGSEDDWHASDTAHAFSRLLGEGRVDGLLVATGAFDDAFVQRIGDADRPVVVVNRRVSGVPSSVVVDDQAGGMAAVKHLIDLGHRRIGHVGGPRTLDTARRRFAGYEVALADAGLSVRPDYVALAEDWSAEAGYRAATDLLSHSDVTAIFAGTVTTAVGALRAAHDLGRDVPRDLSVVALHDYSLASLLTPALTTVSLPLEELGRQAVEMLVGMLEGKPGEHRLVDGGARLLVRESTAPIGS